MATNIIDRFITIESTLLPWGRNIAVHMAFMNDPDFTHFLFIDDDMAQFNSDHVMMMLKADKPIISGIMTQRKYPFKVVSALKDGTDIIDAVNNRKVVQAEHTGMAFTLIKREVFEDTREETPDGSLWFNCDREVRPGFDAEKEIQIDRAYKSIINQKEALEEQEGDLRKLLNSLVLLGQTSHIGSQMLGEDIGFCKRAVAAGHTIWVHCGIIIGHIGSQVFSLADNIRTEMGHADNKQEVVNA